MRTVITPLTHDTAQLGAFIDYLHRVREDERVSLARTIHDDLGSLLVSVAMDLGWAESHLGGGDVRSRLRRLGANLASAIDMKRHMIENLRPTLLDNFGLFEALRWYFKHACHHVKARCNEHYPPAELSLNSRALSNIFRATQTLLDCTFAEEDLNAVDLKASIENEELSIRLGHEHLASERVDVVTRFPNELASAAHRVAMFQGELSLETHETGLTFSLIVPITELGHRDQHHQP
jgi:signal transduction histidine kinase